MDRKDKQSKIVSMRKKGLSDSVFTIRSGTYRFQKVCRLQPIGMSMSCYFLDLGSKQLVFTAFTFSTSTLQVFPQKEWSSNLTHNTEQNKLISALLTTSCRDELFTPYCCKMQLEEEKAQRVETQRRLQKEALAAAAAEVARATEMAEAAAAKAATADAIREAFNVAEQEAFKRKAQKIRVCRR